jgi:uncharacterized protein YkwD
MARSRRTAALLSALAAVALAAPSAASAADCPGADVVPTADTLEQAAQATLCLLNDERGARSLRPLARNATLDRVSAAYSQRMVAENFFAHTAPDGSTLTTRLRGGGYIRPNTGWVIGENIAWGQGPLSTARSTVAAWMDSPGHRENILSADYREIGIGIVPGTPGDTSWGATYTTDFGSYAPGAPAGAAAQAGSPPAASAPRPARRAHRRAARRCGRIAGRAVKTRTKRARARARTCARAARRVAR